MIKKELIRQLQDPDILELQDRYFEQNGCYLPFNIDDFASIEAYREALLKGAEEQEKTP